MSFNFSFVLKVSGCSFSNSVVDDFITGQGFSNTAEITATIDDISVPVLIQTNGFFKIDLSRIKLLNGIHNITLFTESDECSAFLLVFNKIKVLVVDLDFNALLTFLTELLSERKFEIIGLIIGFVVKYNNLISPCNFINLIQNLKSPKIGVVYANALKVIEFFKIKLFLTRASFNEDVACLKIQLKDLSDFYCQVIDILNFPKTQDAVFQFQDTVKIDLSKLVVNHEDGFVYKINCQDTKGDIKLDGHFLFYSPPELSIFSIHLTEEIIYQVTSLEGRVNLGKIIIKAID